MGILSFLGDIASTWMGNRAAKKQQKAEHEFNAKEAEKARQFNSEEAEKSRDWQTSEREATQQWNLEQWNRENEYNSPEAQLQRAMAAGINPNAAVQGISGSSNAGNVRSSAGSGAQASGPAASSSGSIAGSLAELVGNTVNNFWDNNVKRAEATGKDIDNAYKPQINEAELKKADAEANKLLADTKLSEEQRKSVIQSMNVIAMKTPLEIQAIVAGINEVVASTDLIKEQTETEDAQQKVLEAQEANIEQDTENKKKEGDILGHESTIKSIQAGLAEQGIVAGYNDIQSLFIAAKSGVDIGSLVNPYLMLHEGQTQVDTNAYVDRKVADVNAANNMPQELWTRVPELIYNGVDPLLQLVGGYLEGGVRTGRISGAEEFAQQGFEGSKKRIYERYNMPTYPQGGTIYGSPGKYYKVVNGRIIRIKDGEVAKLKRQQRKK